jgi:hypothetical protein
MKERKKESTEIQNLKEIKIKNKKKIQRSAHTVCLCISEQTVIISLY